jgi:hypothetical protein
MSITLVKGFLEQVGMARAGREERFLYAQADPSQENEGEEKVGLLLRNDPHGNLREAVAIRGG